MTPLTDGFANDYWYHHDQISEHNYAGVGIGLEISLAKSEHFAHLYNGWSETVFDCKYASEARG